MHTPAIEYLIRSGLIKNWLFMPCSLFLYKKNKKLIVSINEEFELSEFYSVKHWHIDSCQKDSALPPISEFKVYKSNLYFSPEIIVSEFKLLDYVQNSIPSDCNTYRKPMTSELYNTLYNSALKSHKNEAFRMNWLWKQFISIYFPNLEKNIEFPYYSEEEIAQIQRQLIQTNFKKLWLFWEKWKKHMLLNSAELIFYPYFTNK